MRTVLHRLLEQRAQPLPAFWRNTILVVAAGGVLMASVWAWRSSGLQTGDLDWAPIAILLLVAAPVSLLLKAAEFALAASLPGQRPPTSLLL
ncbi:MAG: hypothetical protein GWP47_02430 [Actinobacteria bacterium]|nr:hypothetical protein [Actinomycetota bacterium]